MQKTDIPYAEIDPGIRELVRALNEFPGIATLGSCSGHADKPGCGGWTAGNWYVSFQILRWSEAKYSLEFLAWLINHDMVNRKVFLFPESLPPYLNGPGRCLHFVIEGHDGEDPDELAAWIDRMREEYFYLKVLSGKEPVSWLQPVS